MEALKSVKVLIRETQVDLIGHMNNATYMQIFEDARWDALTERGYGIDKIRATKLGPVILGMEVKFLKEILVREEITVTTELIEYVDKIGKLRQKMIKADGTIACDVEMIFGLFDMKARKLVLPTPEWEHAIGLRN